MKCYEEIMVINKKSSPSAKGKATSINSNLRRQFNKDEGMKLKIYDLWCEDVKASSL